MPSPDAPDTPPWRIRGVVLPDDEVREVYLIGDRITLDRQPGARTLTDSGFILPGLIDAHCHIGIRTSGAPVANPEEAANLAIINRDTGVLGIRDAGSPVAYPQLRERPDLPRLIRAGRHLAPPGRYIPGVALECTPSQLPAAVATQAALGDGWVKVVADYFDADRDGIVANWPTDALRDAVRTAHGLGVRVAAHTLGDASVAEALVAAGIDSVEHGIGLTESAIVTMARHGTALVPTRLAVDTLRYVATLAERDHPDYAATLRSSLDRFPDVVRAAHDIGVPIYVGTDAGPEVRHGRIVEEILTLHCRTGIPAAALLAAASWSARDWLGLGRLTEGGPADLTVYDHDPRRDLTELRTPTRIILRGRVLR
jgi:imidazolonepropionase-like amidohydrolase